jgi:hypothetical protein
MRIEHFPELGTHIDLDHIISVSDVYLVTEPGHAKRVVFDVQYILRDAPVEFMSGIKRHGPDAEFRYVHEEATSELMREHKIDKILHAEWRYRNDLWIRPERHSQPERIPDLLCVTRWQAVANHLITRWKRENVPHPSDCRCYECIDVGINGGARK